MRAFFKAHGGALLLMALGLGSWLFGLARGEVSVYWNRAIRICLECIGLG